MVSFKYLYWYQSFDYEYDYYRCDLHLGINDAVGNHDDIATCLQFSEETSEPLFPI